MNIYGNFFLSGGACSMRLETLIWLSGLRWAIEQCFEETKTELGMDHYEVRKFPGWHHHILTCMLGHFFLWHLKIRLGKKTPFVTVSQLKTLLRVVLPMRSWDAKNILELVIWVQQKNHRAYLSHRRRRLRQTINLEQVAL